MSSSPASLQPGSLWLRTQGPGTAGSLAAIPSPGRCTSTRAWVPGLRDPRAGADRSRQSGPRMPPLARPASRTRRSWLSTKWWANGSLRRGGGGSFNWKTWLAAFALFRAFDIWKPPPVRQLERLHGGTGIVLDDLMAGVYAALVLYAAGCFNR